MLNIEENTIKEEIVENTQDSVSNNDTVEYLLPSPISEKHLRDSIDSSSLQLLAKAMDAENYNALAEYEARFNLNMHKKNLLRQLKLSDVEDKVSDEILDRVTNHADELSNIELSNYLKVINDYINNSRKRTSTEEMTPAITLNQQTNNVTVNIEDNKLDRKSRENIINAVNKLLKMADSVQSDIIVEEIQEEKKE